ncbi:MAG: SUMF1/EgtB/PvdO family nonheme iron enzyme [Planctomycetota bacterium]
MEYKKSSSFFVLISALTLACGFLGCNRSSPSPQSQQILHFPEIENMALVVVDNASHDGANTTKSVYFVDRFEVTNRDFSRFMRQSGYQPPDSHVFLDHWAMQLDGSLAPLPDDLDLPVVFVNHADALSYARFYGKDLPTREQWLWAAVGWVGKKSFPWGDQFMNFYCNSWRSGIRGLSKVGTFEYGKSEWGCYDLVGNAAEWCSTRATDQIEESYYILGGSWSQGGTPQEEEKVFSLSSHSETAETTSRNNTLGFRCVRNDALAYIRDILVPRIAALAWEERIEAMNELSDITEPLYAVLKLLQFEAAVSQPLSTHPSLALACFQENSDKDEEGFLFCHDDGFIRSCTLDGRELWKRKEVEKDAPYRFKTLSCYLKPSDKIISYSWLNSLLAIFNAGSGEELWRVGRGGLAQHMVPIRPENFETAGGELLLVVWYTEDRYEVIGGEIKTLLDEMYTLIKAYSGIFLTREALNSSLRDKYLSFFINEPEVAGIGSESQFNMDCFGDLDLYFDGALRRRFWIQLLNGEYSNTEIRYAPACWLTLYDLDTGTVHWTLDLPGALFEFKGVVHWDPVVFDHQKRVAIVLEEDRYEAGDAEQVRLCILDFQTGIIEFQFVFEGRDNSITGLTVLEANSHSLAGIVGFQDLLIIDCGEAGGDPLQRKTLLELLDSVVESILISRNGEPARVDNLPDVLPWYDIPGYVEEEDSSPSQPHPPALHDLWALCSAHPPWLVTEPDLNGNRLLLTGHEQGPFKKAFILGGGYDRYAFLQCNDDTISASYMLIWDSSGNLLCFDALASRYLWKLEVGSIAELMKPVMTDLNHDGSYEAAIPTLSGEIKVIELDSGKNILNMMRVGASFTFLIPVEADEDVYQEMLIGLKDRGIFLMNGFIEAEDKEAVNLRFTINALEQWKTVKRGR